MSMVIMQNSRIIPKCKTDEEHQITATGHWVPCCNVPQYDSRFKELIFSGEDFKIKSASDIGKFHKHPAFLKWIGDIESGASEAPKFCKLKCSQQVVDAGRDNPFMITNGQEVEYG